MSSCSCSPDFLVSVTFGNGTVMLRCPSHEAQRWLVDGRPVDAPVALNGLRSLFVEHRGARATGKPARPVREPAPAARVIQLPQTSPSIDPARVDAESLTALLHARGLSGSWSVA